MNKETEIPDKRTKIREQAGILLLVLVLAGSGFLILNNGQKKSDINFVQGQNSTANTSAATKAATTPKSTTSTGTQDASKQAAKININTASIEDLDKLTGVGPATAQKIIDYRNTNGPFQSIESIKDVSGIGDVKYEKMKDQLSI